MLDAVFIHFLFLALWAPLCLCMNVLNKCSIFCNNLSLWTFLWLSSPVALVCGYLLCRPFLFVCCTHAPKTNYLVAWSRRSFTAATLSSYFCWSVYSIVPAAVSCLSLYSEKLSDSPFKKQCFKFYKVTSFYNKMKCMLSHAHRT